MKTKRILLTAAVVGAAVIVAASPAFAAPVYKLPFPCGQVWGGSTYAAHHPPNAIDFNRTDDVDDYVTASAPGTVDVVADLGTATYGKYVRINHTNGHTTYYAHLNSQWVYVGQIVGYGTVIGTVGSTGDSTGPHLHYEQRLNGTAGKVKFDGVQAAYPSAVNYNSSNGCAGAGTGAGNIDTANGAAQIIYSGAGTSTGVAGSIANGTYVTIQCQLAGQTVAGRWGTSNVWNRIGSGRHVPDVNTYTGYNGFIAGVHRC